MNTWKIAAIATLGLAQTLSAQQPTRQVESAPATGPAVIQYDTVGSGGMVGTVNGATLTLIGSDRATEKAAFLGVAVSSAPGVIRDQLKLPRGVGLVVDHVEADSPAAA